MKCRSMVNKEIVWFNSYGKTIMKQRSNYNYPSIFSVPDTIKGQSYVATIHYSSINPTVDGKYRFHITFGRSVDPVDILVNAGTYVFISTLPECLVGVDLQKYGGGPLPGWSSVDPDEGDFVYINFVFQEYSESKKYNNYSEGQEGVNASLTQRLSVLKSELWYDINAGVPLLDKVKNKYLIDSSILSIITNHPDVVRIIKFDSSVINGIYSCNVNIQTKYGDLTIKV